ESNCPDSMCHVQPPSQSPVVGRPFTLQGQPKSQLQAMKSVPFIEHFSATATREPYKQPSRRPGSGGVLGCFFEVEEDVDDRGVELATCRACELRPGVRD